MSQMFKLEDGGVVMLDAVQAVYDRSAIGYASRWEIYLKYCERPLSISSDDADRLIKALGEYVERPTIREGDELRNMNTKTGNRVVPKPPPPINRKSFTRFNSLSPHTRDGEGRPNNIPPGSQYSRRTCPHCHKPLDGTRTVEGY